MNERIRWLGVPRVLGLVLVLIYHLFKESLPGGFLGVDVFFTISGFLITLGIIGNYRKGGFDFFSFLKKRVVRIFPPLFLTIIYTLPFMYLISPDFIVGLGKQLAAAFGMVTNVYEISTGGSYEAQLLPHLYIHTWSLAAEIHFYIFWGILCAVLGTFLSRNISKRTELAKSVFNICLLAISVTAAAASYIFMLVSFKENTDTSAAYMSSFSHAFPFFIGSAAAVIASGMKKSDRKPSPKTVIPILATATAAIIGIVALSRNLHFNEAPVFRYGFLLASILTVVIIYCALALHRVMPAQKRESAPLRILTDLSYDMYLLHWPLYIVFSTVITNNVLAAITVISISLFLSVIMFYRIEPIFHFKNSAKRPKISKVSKTPKKTDSSTAPKIPRTVIAKRAGYALTAVASVVSITLSCLVVLKTPEINSIEEDINSGKILSSEMKLSALKRWVMAINKDPIISVTNLSKGLEANAVTQMNVPDGSAQPAATTEDTEPPTLNPPIPAPNTASTRTPNTTSEPLPTAAPNPPPSQAQDISVPGGVTIIGDSVCLGAQRQLPQSIENCFVDAAGSRNVQQGYDVMLGLQERGSLAKDVVISLGTNNHSEREKYFNEIINALEPGHRLIFVTPFDGRSPSGGAEKMAVWLRTLPEIYPYITIADWNATISPQRGLLQEDTVHLNGSASVNVYVNCIIDALAVSQGKPVK